MKPTHAASHAVRRRPKYSALPFVLTLGTAILLLVASWTLEYKDGLHPARAQNTPLLKRDVVVQDAECRLVHRAADKCAFVHANCPDEEAGIFSYLTLYYCRLPHAKPVAFAILVLWLSLLFSTIGIAASDFFCVNLNTIANLLGMSESMAGVTFLAFGNGSPDVFSTFAAMSTNSASLAIGELVGAAGFITAVVAGSMALVRPFTVAKKSFVRDVGFFIVAASFSMVFLWDGKLSLWESATMVGFYVFYVCFVMVWHWYIGRRKARLRRAATMRSHYIMPGGEEEEPQQQYRDDDDDGPAGGSAEPPVDDFAALERAGVDHSREPDDEMDEEARERWLGELSSNMRVSRPGMRSRRNTHVPIRPSLVGALEFRTLLSSLQKSRNIQSMPIDLRRYSDDPTFTSAQQQDNLSSTSDPALRPPYYVQGEASHLSPTISRPAEDVQRQIANRARAVSTNDLDNARFDPSTLEQGTVPSIEFDPASSDPGYSGSTGAEQTPPSPSISLSQPPSELGSRSTSPAPQRARHASPNTLAPPDFSFATSQPPRQGTTSPSPLSSPTHGPNNRSLPKLTMSTIPFPPYTDYPSSAQSSRAPSIRLPPPSVSPESLFHGENIFESSEHAAKVPRWWPSRALPFPHVLFSTLFPTLTGWKGRSLWEKFLGVIAAPSVFLLTITLPVVDTPKDDQDEEDTTLESLSLPGPRTPAGSSDGHYHNSRISVVSPETLVAGGMASPHKSGNAGQTASFKAVGQSRSSGRRAQSHGGVPQLSITTEDMVGSPEQLPTESSLPEAQSWNRWLVILQAFTAPLFIVVIIWANTELENPRALVKPVLYALIFSLVMLAAVLATTTPDRPPRWRPLLCFLGFVVSIAWISSIANEVVGVLKTLGVILNMSDAILGLTIFAVGNSLGDFVADITVARLGFPVMALSACFGGPMLNILLGIGISGCYLTIKGSQHRHHKHPDRPIKFKPYHIDVSTTLVISGAALLVTLLGLLVAVPMRRWRMDRTIGWGLVALWVVSTVANVIVEVTGFSSSVS